MIDADKHIDDTEQLMNQDHIVHTVDIIRSAAGKKTLMTDQVIDEDILEILINQKPCFEMVCSMTHVQKLAAGFLFTQGIVRKKSDLQKIQFLADKKQCCLTVDSSIAKQVERFTNSRLVKGSSGGTMLKTTLADAQIPPHSNGRCITPEQVCDLIHRHADHSKLFHQTGAVHSAALCTPEQILFYAEDIGRHNALDKLAGHILLEQVDVSDKIATISCRMSLEIVGKIIQTGIRTVISNAAPTLGAIQLAADSGLTLIGFARGDRFNIYSHGNRVC